MDNTEKISKIFKKEGKVYVVHGYWDAPDYDGVAIVKITTSEEKAAEALAMVAESQAKEYITMGGYLQEERDDRRYEATNGEKYAKFYITEEAVDYEE